MDQRSFKLNLEETIYQAALKRAQNEGKTLEQVLTEHLTAYAGKTASRPTSYTVQRGDTLSRIAAKVYGDAHQFPLLQEANKLDDPGHIWVGQVLVVPPLSGAVPASTPPAAPAPAPAPKPPAQPASPAPPAPPATPPPAATPPPPPATPTPPSPPPVTPSPATEVKVTPETPIPEENYGTLPVVGRPTDRPAAEHGDINLALRGFEPTSAKLSLIDISGATDNRAPQLKGLFADKRTPLICGAYQVHHWDWGRNARGGPVTDCEVTLTGFEVEPGETIHVPGADYSIGQGYNVMVLYADTERITLKYTGEDSVVNGYTIQVEGVCVEPRLRELYERMNSEGRRHLPALRAGQAFGRARSGEIQVAIRDTGRFMDPRSRKDWWRR